MRESGGSSRLSGDPCIWIPGNVLCHRRSGCTAEPALLFQSSPVIALGLCWRKLVMRDG